mgnify:FL=1
MIKNFLDLINELKKGRRLTNDRIKKRGKNDYIKMEYIPEKQYVDIYLSEMINPYSMNSLEIFYPEKINWEIKKYNFQEILKIIDTYKDVCVDFTALIVKIRRISWDENKFISGNSVKEEIGSIDIKDLLADDWEILGKEINSELNIFDRDSLFK